MSIEGLEKPLKMNDLSSVYPQVIEYFDPNSNRIKVTITREETDRSKIENILKAKKDANAESKKRFDLHSEQLRNLYSLGTDTRKLHLELDTLRRGSQSNRPVMSKAYRIYATFMLIVSAVLLFSICVQTLCFKSPIPDFFIVVLVSFIVYNIIEDQKALIFAVIILVVSILFDFVIPSL